MNEPQNPLEKEFKDNLQSIEVIAPEVIREFHQNTAELPSTDEAEPKSIFEDYFVFEKKDATFQKTSNSVKRPEITLDNRRFDIEFVPLVKENVSKSAVIPVVDVDENKGAVKAVIELPEANKTFDVQNKTSAFNESLKERIIQFFLSLSKARHVEQRPARTKNKPLDENFKAFNVFEDLFRTCDVDKKLILMDEIVAVGDERDIDFVEELLDDSDIMIAKKAEKVLKMLERKLANENKVVAPPSTNIINDRKEIVQPDHIDGTVLLEYSILLDEMEIEPPKNPNIFDVGFELSEQAPLEHPNTSEGYNNEQNL